jgi:hypothetical protein
MSLNSYKDLIVWQKSYELVKQAYKLTECLAAELETQLLLCKDLYGKDITTQLRLLYEVQKMLGSLNRKLVPKT